MNYKMNFCQENFLTAEKIVNSRINSFNNRKLFEGQKNSCNSILFQQETCSKKKTIFRPENSLKLKIFKAEIFSSRKLFRNQKVAWRVESLLKKIVFTPENSLNSRNEFSLQVNELN